MNNKGELETNLFDKAMKWYMSFDDGKKAAALELFPEDMLKKEIENYKKRDKEERLKLRETELKNNLERAKKMFPIGTVVWSDDGCDHCPNLIIGEPYIGNTKYGTHIPYDKYDLRDNDDDKKTILAPAVRIFMGNVDTEHPHIFKSIVGLEKILCTMDKPEEHRYPHKEFIVDLYQYALTQMEKRSNEIKNLEDKIRRNQKEIDEWKEELKEWKDYDPFALNEERIKELTEEFKI